MQNTYEIEGAQVVVTWQEIDPDSQVLSKDEALLFFPGWPLKKPVKSMHILGETIAEYTKKRTFIVYSDSDQITAYPVSRDAKAICSFIFERKLRHITLIGLSQGALKAMYISVFLKDRSPTINIKGLIMVNSSGLNDIDDGLFVRRQLIDDLIKIPLMVIIESLRQFSLLKKISFFITYLKMIFGIAPDLLGTILLNIITSPQIFYAKLKTEVSEGTERSRYLDQVRVPVIMIQSTHDRTFNTENMISLEEMKAMQKFLNVETKRDASKWKSDRGEPIIAEYLFPHCPYLRLIKPKKFGIHLILIFRAKSIVRSSQYLLQKFNEHERSNIGH